DQAARGRPARRVRDLGERLPALELRDQVTLGDAEVRGGIREIAMTAVHPPAEVPEGVPAARRRGRRSGGGGDRGSGGGIAAGSFVARADLRRGDRSTGGRQADDGDAEGDRSFV